MPDHVPTSGISVDPWQMRPDHHWNPVTSKMAVYGFGWIGLPLLLAASLALLARYRRWARHARSEYDPSVRPHTGEVILHGKVEYEDDDAMAIRVEVTQNGAEYETSGGWSHKWTEFDRKVKVKPFYLRVGTRRIRVEPDEKVRFLDSMDQSVYVNLTSRVRIAELSPGETVYAKGVLSRVPTDGGEEWVLRPGPGMMISSLPLGEPFRLRARLHARFAGGIAVTLLVVHFLIQASGYYPLAWHGEVGQGVVTSKDTYTTTDDEGDETTHYQVHIAIQEPPSLKHRGFSNTVDSSLYNQLSKDQIVPIRSTPMATPATIGTEATLETGPALWLIISFLVWLGTYRWRSSKPVGWWEGPLVETGKGKLEECS